ncbi:hypothetical protein PCA31118_01185 [Pandoraea captiosa]|uniref:Uncharacterized protein n=1 Tax=Pandoraea captiosa TaxID=2508302 RepID=A0A5E4ZTG3_9BURK|nr:hypothetical protein [Pandoraea captiosa]VVE63260.1 hypothetical protein PCA31118_01185 [Pandoraea captiosa]
MENRISSSLHPVAAAAQTVALRTESPRAQDATPMAAELTNVGHGPVMSMASAPARANAIADVTERRRLACARVDSEFNDLWRAVEEGYRREHDARTPKSFYSLSESDKRLVVKRAVDEVFKENANRIDGYFNRLTANADVKEHLKKSISQGTRDAAYALFGNLDVYSDKRTHLMNRITKYGMVYSDDSWHLAHAKDDMWSAVRKAVYEEQAISVPESFDNLTEVEKKKLAKLTVDWVFSPVNDETAPWFEKFTADTTIQPYLTNTVPYETYREVAKAESLARVRDLIDAYGMREEDTKNTIETAKAEILEVVRNGVAERKNTTGPESFMYLTEDAKRKVAKLTIDWALNPINQETELWFYEVVGKEFFRNYVKNTVPKATYEAIIKCGGLGRVKDTILDYDMLQG